MAYLCLLQQHPDRSSLEKSGRCCKTCKYRKYLQVSDRASNPPPRDLEARTPKPPNIVQAANLRSLSRIRGLEGFRPSKQKGFRAEELEGFGFGGLQIWGSEGG